MDVPPQWDYSESNTFFRNVNIPKVLATFLVAGLAGWLAGLDGWLAVWLAGWLGWRNQEPGEAKC